MPEGPWIKRNPFGVVFTEDMMPSENSISIEDTFRESENRMSDSNQSYVMGEEESEEKRTISKKEEFLRKLQFDVGVEERLNKLMKSKDN